MFHVGATQVAIEPSLFQDEEMRLASIGRTCLIAFARCVGWEGRKVSDGPVSQ
jgi:hypothetical protein